MYGTASIIGSAPKTENILNLYHSIILLSKLMTFKVTDLSLRLFAIDIIGVHGPGVTIAGRGGAFGKGAALRNAMIIIQYLILSSGWPNRFAD